MGVEHSPWTGGVLALCMALSAVGTAGTQARTIRSPRQPQRAQVGGLRVFEAGTYQPASPARLRTAEAWVASSHQTWRTDPILVLLVETGTLLPGHIRDWIAPSVAHPSPGLKIVEKNPTLGLSATYVIGTVRNNRITASLTVSGSRYHIDLRRPLQRVWWVIRADKV